MSTSPSNEQSLQSRHLHSVPNTGGDLVDGFNKSKQPTKRQLFIAGSLAPIALTAAFAAQPVFNGIQGGFDAVKSVFTNPNPKQPDGISVKQLREVPNEFQITITPTQAQAVKGPGELGELVDPQVYPDGSHENSTTAHNLNVVIGDQHGGDDSTIYANVPYKVPSISPTGPITSDPH